MHPKKTFKTAIILLLLGTIVYSFQSCTKENNPKPGAQYYFSADVNGTPWQANVEEAVDSAGGTGVLGLMIHGQDTSAILLILNDQVDYSHPVPINNATSFADSTLTAIVVYLGNKEELPTISYATPFTLGDAGVVTTAQMDTANQLVSGTFHATVSTQSGHTLAITNGKFKARIISGNSQFGRELMKGYGF
jgi:hypothetical protein